MPQPVRRQSQRRSQIRPMQKRSNQNVSRFPNLRNAARFTAGQFRGIAQNALNRGRDFAKERLRQFSAKEEQQLEFKEEQAQELAQMRRIQRARFLEERKIKEHYSAELKQIKEELNKIINILKQGGGFNFRNLNNNALMDRITINLFKKFGNKTAFVLKKSQANKNALRNILISVEQELSFNRISLSKITPKESELVEGIINQSIENTLNEANENGIKLEY